MFLAIDRARQTDGVVVSHAVMISLFSPYVCLLGCAIGRRCVFWHFAGLAV